MNIQSEKIELVQMLLNTQSEAVIRKVRSILKKEDADWWNEISTEEKAAIEKGIAQLEKGQGVPHKVVMQQYGRWLKK